jgi:hypothetical protein
MYSRGIFGSCVEKTLRRSASHSRLCRVPSFPTSWKLIVPIFSSVFAISSRDLLRTDTQDD